MHGSKKAVLTAIFGNSVVTLAKFGGFLTSGSSALLAETVHSLADTMNQCLLYLGLRRSERLADKSHHFGYGQERYFWNLVSAVTIFFLGCVYTVMHAVGQLEEQHLPDISWISFAIIGIAFVVEGYSFFVALTEFRHQAKEEGRSLRNHFVETRDPTTLAVLIEDAVAVLGLILALVGMMLSSWLHMPVFDAIAAICIGLLMGMLAFYLASMNRKYLLNRSDDEVTEVATHVWNASDHVQQVHRVNSIVLSPEETLLMAELELREEELFADMSAEEVAQAIRFMHKLSDIRHSLEEEVSRIKPEAKHIFIEVTSPDDKP